MLPNSGFVFGSHNISPVLCKSPNLAVAVQTSTGSEIHEEPNLNEVPNSDLIYSSHAVQCNAVLNDDEKIKLSKSHFLSNIARDVHRATKPKPVCQWLITGSLPTKNALVRCSHNSRPEAFKLTQDNVKEPNPRKLCIFDVPEQVEKLSMT